MSNVSDTVFKGKRLHDGMIKSKKTRVGDVIIAVICFIFMLMCLLPMVHRSVYRR